jgi:hypothetical protein
MQQQLSQTYNVDARYAETKRATDNETSRRFVSSYIKKRKLADQSGVDRSVESRFTVSGPGDSTYTFQNAFRASK